jgi:hypothetical protein
VATSKATRRTYQDLADEVGAGVSKVIQLAPSACARQPDTRDATPEAGMASVGARTRARLASWWRGEGDVREPAYFARQREENPELPEGACERVSGTG